MTEKTPKSGNERILRPIHYLGSKLRLIPEISSTIDEFDPSGGTVCDLFSGSGTVTNFLSSKRRVVSVDVQEYSRVISSALLFRPKININQNEFLDRCRNSGNTYELTKCFHDLLDYEVRAFDLAKRNDFRNLADLIDFGSILDFIHCEETQANNELRNVLRITVENMKIFGYDVSNKAMITRYFGGIYFSFNQSIAIDSILEIIDEYTDKTKDLLLAALLSTVSDIVNTIGKQFAQPIKAYKKNGEIKNELFTKIKKDRIIDVYDLYSEWLYQYLNQEPSEYLHSVVCTDFLENSQFLKDENVKIVYADPPYTRLHYSRYYHVLESICLRDNPEISKTDRGDQSRLSRGKYRIDRFQSDFCISSKAENAFASMFQIVSSCDIPLILSYSPFDESLAVSPRLRTVEQLVELASLYFNEITVKNVSRFKHSKLNSVENLLETSKDSEVLICCRNRSQDEKQSL